MKYAVTKHAVMRCSQRFGIKPEHVRNWVNQCMEYAEFLGNAINANGIEGRLYGHRGKVFVLAAKENKVLTVIEPRRIPAVSERMKKLILNEVEKIEKRAAANQRKIQYMSAEMERELAECKMKLLRARSEAKRLALSARIKALESRVRELNEDITDIKRSKARFAKGLAAHI